MNEKVTGKKILCEFAVLAKDVGTYIFCIGKRVVTKIKCALSDKKDKKAPHEQDKEACSHAS